MTQVSTVGARERRKERTREALEQTAVALFAERGFDNVTVDEVVAAAGVSKRTFYRYYDSKEDLLVADQLRMFDRLRVALRDRPAGERILDAVRHAVADAHTDDSHDERLLPERMRLLAETPALATRLSAHYLHLEVALAEILAARLGVEDDPGDLRPRMLAAAILSMLRVVTFDWMRAGAEGALSDRITHWFDDIGKIAARL